MDFAWFRNIPITVLQVTYINSSFKQFYLFAKSDSNIAMFAHCFSSILNDLVWLIFTITFTIPTHLFYKIRKFHTVYYRVLIQTKKQKILQGYSSFLVLINRTHGWYRIVYTERNHLAFTNFVNDILYKYIYNEPSTVHVLDILRTGTYVLSVCVSVHVFKIKTNGVKVLFYINQV